jgi:dipeptidyl aminopeptidase/acylaminoacyl peptidase
VLLEHGDADYNVPLAQTTALADALRAKDIPVDATVFPGMEHLTIIEGGIAEPPIAEWMKGWTGSS